MTDKTQDDGNPSMQLESIPAIEAPLGLSQVKFTIEDNLATCKQKLKKELRWRGSEVDSLIQVLQSGLTQLASEKDDNRRAELLKRLNDNCSNKLMCALALDTKHFMISAVDASDSAFVSEVFDELVTEFNVKMASEKALLQTIALSFVQFLKYTNLLNVNSTKIGLGTDYLQVISKEADRCYRRYISGIQVLMQLKTPPVHVNVKANNAYMSQNQQINNQPSDETNKTQ